MQRLLSGAQMAAALGDFMPCQCLGVMREMYKVHWCATKLCRQLEVLRSIDLTVVKYLRMSVMFRVSPRFHCCVDLAARFADERPRGDESEARAAWRSWLAGAFASHNTGG